MKIKLTLHQMKQNRKVIRYLKKEAILLGIVLAAIISLPAIIPNLRDTFGETEDASKKQS